MVDMVGMAALITAIAYLIDVIRLVIKDIREWENDNKI